MNARDLFQKIVNFEESKRTLKWEFAYWGSTIKRWYKEGLPKKIGFDRELVYGETVFGPGLQWPMYSYDESLLFAHDVSSYFNLDKGPSPFPFNWWLCPTFEREVLKETENKIEYIGNDGIRRLAFKNESSMPQWLEFPVKNKSDWEKIKSERLNLDNFDERLRVDDLDNFIIKARDRDYPMCLYGSPIGFFASLRLLIGEVNLYHWYYDKPDLLKEISEYLCNFWLNIAEELTSKIDFDYGRFAEDIAYKNGPLIGPKLIEEFILPYYKRLTDFAKLKGVKHFILDTDGYIEEDIIPLFLRGGVNGILPIEIQAGNNLLRIREKYPNYLIFGGIDKIALLRKEEIDRELSMVTELIKKGGFVPYVDHLVPPNVSWKNFIYYRKKLDKIIDSTSVKPLKLKNE